MIRFTRLPARAFGTHGLQPVDDDARELLLLCQCGEHVVGPLNDPVLDASPSAEVFQVAAEDEIQFVNPRVIFGKEREQFNATIREGV